MRRLLTVLTAAIAVVTFGSTVFAQAATPTMAPEKKVEKPAAKVEKALPESATGVVAKVDETAKTFTVTMKSGEKEFSLAPDAKITAGAKTEKVADLAGKHVKVTYTMLNGKNVASKVAIASEPTTQARADTSKKVAKK